MKHHIQKARTMLPALTGIFLLFCFSFFLMFRTFGYDQKLQVIKIAPKLWSDFGAHIPLIRSFSMGPNTDRLLHLQPIESPLYPGEPIRYHFGFYAIAGILEKIGARIDWALNIPSALGMFLLLLGIWWLSKELFKNSWVSLLSILFFLFNGSFSFLTFFRNNPLSTSSLYDIVSASRFATFGPWDGQDITAFWSLNIFTNQRHLALSYAIVILILSYLVHLKNTSTHIKPVVVHALLLGTGLAFLFFINFAAASIAALFLTWFFLVHKPARLPLLFAAVLAGPSFLLLQHLSNVSSNIVLEPWYVSHAPHTFQSIAWFWTQNIGLHIILIPLGFLIAPKNVKKLFIVPLLILIIAPNVFRFSSDMINNHKFFNFFIIIGGMFSAYSLSVLWNLFQNKLKILRIITYPLVISLTFFLMLSGIIDFFPIINDHEGGLTDYTNNEDARFILKNSPKDAVFANSYWFYHPAQLVGRAVYSGYTYFTFSYGYDQGGREKNLLAIYRANTAQEACMLMKHNHVEFVELAKNPEAYVEPNLALWEQIVPDYTNESTDLKIFSIATICKN